MHSADYENCVAIRSSRHRFLETVAFRRPNDRVVAAREGHQRKEGYRSRRGGGRNIDISHYSVIDCRRTNDGCDLDLRQQRASSCGGCARTCTADEAGTRPSAAPLFLALTQLCDAAAGAGATESRRSRSRWNRRMYVGARNVDACYRVCVCRRCRLQLYYCSVSRTSHEVISAAAYHGVRSTSHGVSIRCAAPLVKNWLPSSVIWCPPVFRLQRCLELRAKRFDFRFAFVCKCCDAADENNVGSDSDSDWCAAVLVCSHQMLTMKTRHLGVQISVRRASHWLMTLALQVSYSDVCFLLPSLPYCLPSSHPITLRLAVAYFR